MSLRETRIEKALLYLEPGPLVLVTTSEGGRDNVMTISWTMPLDFDGHFAMATGPWNYSFKALKKTRDCAVCIPECPEAAIYAEEDVPEDQQEFIELNAELAREWPSITHRKPAPDDADEWRGKTGKIQFLKKSWD